MTIGVAAATLVFVAVILVAPTYVQCAGAFEGVAACLRTHFLDTDGFSKSEPQDIAEVAVPPRSTGRLEADATPTVKAPTATTRLALTEGSVALADGGTAPPVPNAPVTLSPLRGNVSASAAAPQMPSVATTMLRAPTAEPQFDSSPGEIGVSGQGASPLPPVTVTLAPEPGQLLAAVPQPSAPIVPQASLAAGAGTIEVALSAAIAETPAVRVTPTPGSLHLTASEPLASGTPYIATLAAPAGRVSTSPPPPAAIAIPAPVELGVIPDALPAGTMSAFGTVPTSPIGTAIVRLTAKADLPASGRLDAASAAAPASPPATVTVTPDRASVAPSIPAPPAELPPVEVLPRPVAVDPPASSPLRLMVDDPRYPSVLILPPPSTGENSSIITLEIGG